MKESRPKIGELINKFQHIIENKSDIYSRIKKEYPEPVEKDLTSKYIDVVLDSLEDLLRPEEYDTYKNSLKIKKGISYPLETVAYMYYQIFGLYGEDRVISARFGVQASDVGKVTSNYNIFSGFTRNPIGRIDSDYIVAPEKIFENESMIIREMASDMENARERSLQADKAYIDYVARTGDLS